ncbi:hypothetical protein C8F04DRAFT_1064127 [Mycena alexandri]|uniref:Secreted protein n=1 Tax=Mycena alexandri TaxID=1745969 RepID=A0AAD6XFR1_9AGAR|nr:hypothetical protein C8F04DRAFT_1064127 [Mycena alexandri]
MFFRVFAVSALVCVASAANCAVCPTTDLVGDALVANSGGSLGTPRFCGYSPDASGASGPSVECFYNSGGAGSGPGAECPPTAQVENVC